MRATIAGMSNPELRARLARERQQRRAAATPTPIADRLGPALLGLFAGMALGLIAAVGLLAWRPGTASFATCIFGGAAIGALLGALSMDIGFGLAEGLMHFLAGMVSGGVSAFRDGESMPLRPSPSTAGWRHVLFAAGVAVVVVLAALFHWR
jgi:hypothetical protein